MKEDIIEKLREIIIKKIGGPTRTGLFVKSYCDGHDAVLKGLLDDLESLRRTI